MFLWLCDMHFVHQSNIPVSSDLEKKYVISKPRPKDGWGGKWIYLVLTGWDQALTHVPLSKAWILRACHLDVYANLLMVSFVHAYF